MTTIKNNHQLDTRSTNRTYCVALIAMPKQSRVQVLDPDIADQLYS
jgi:hypothetical protein